MLAAFAQVAVMRPASLSLAAGYLNSARKSLDHHLPLFYSSVAQHGTSLRCAACSTRKFQKKSAVGSPRRESLLTGSRTSCNVDFGLTFRSWFLMCPFLFFSVSSII